MSRMFTGIVSAVGRIVEAQALGDDSSHGKRLVIETPRAWLDDVGVGDSIALNGACMTVAALDLAAGRFAIDISAESLSRTAGLAEAGRRINLEKALRANDRLGGHLVAGHVDGIGKVASFEPVGESWRLAVTAPRELARFLAVKGSVAINGVSLTVNRVEDRANDCSFEINLIPHTLAQTTLPELRAGDAVNLEIDLIARYVERMLSGGAAAPAA
jgi:riboflavin synthase